MGMLLKWREVEVPEEKPVNEEVPKVATEEETEQAKETKRKTTKRKE